LGRKRNASQNGPQSSVGSFCSSLRRTVRLSTGGGYGCVTSTGIVSILVADMGRSMNQDSRNWELPQAFCLVCDHLEQQAHQAISSIGTTVGENSDFERWDNKTQAVLSTFLQNRQLRVVGVESLSRAFEVVAPSDAQPVNTCPAPSLRHHSLRVHYVPRVTWAQLLSRWGSV